MDTIVTSLTKLYKELGGEKNIPNGITSTGALALVAEVMGYEGITPLNPTISDIVKLLTSVMAIKDTTVIPYTQETIFEHNVSDLQKDLVVGKDIITGELSYIEEGQLPTAHGAGHFFAVEFSEKDSEATSIKMGMYPTYKNGEFIWDDSGLSDVINDPDKGGAWKVTDKNVQYFKVVTSDGKRVHTQLFDLKELILLPQANVEVEG